MTNTHKSPNTRIRVIQHSTSRRLTLRSDPRDMSQPRRALRGTPPFHQDGRRKTTSRVFISSPFGIRHPLNGQDNIKTTTHKHPNTRVRYTQHSGSRRLTPTSDPRDPNPRRVLQGIAPSVSSIDMVRAKQHPRSPPPTPFGIVSNNCLPSHLHQPPPVDPQPHFTHERHGYRPYIFPPALAVHGMTA